MNIREEVHEGIFAALGGPTYETIAELKFLRIAGVDAVGNFLSSSNDPISTVLLNSALN